MFTNLSLWTWPLYLVSCFSQKLTVPSINAKIVWSLPMEAFSPAKNLVPLCLMMIFPARAICPPKIFTPSLLATESRPLRVEPAAFLCAIVVQI